jgi:hypothetical protein
MEVVETQRRRCGHDDRATKRRADMKKKLFSGGSRERHFYQPAFTR